MKNLDKDFGKEIMMNAWHEVDCSAHSNQMRSEDECNCIYGFIDKKIRAFIRQREKELLDEIEKNFSQSHNVYHISKEYFKEIKFGEIDVALAKQRTQLLKEVREKVIVEGEIYFHQTGKVSVESGIKEQLKKLKELEKDK